MGNKMEWIQKGKDAFKSVLRHSMPIVTPIILLFLCVFCVFCISFVLVVLYFLEYTQSKIKK